MMKSLRLAATLLASAITLCVHAQQSRTDSLKRAESELRHRYDNVQQQRKLLSVFNYLSNMYVDQTDMSPLVERAIVAMLEELDPHSSYISAKDMKGVREQFDGEFSGIGIEFNVHRDTILVINVIAGAPAESAGIRPNDRIVEIDGQSATGISRNDVTAKLRGPTGSKASVGIRRHGIDELLEFEIVRGKIPINTVDAAYLIDEKTGYIKVNRFGHTTMSEFESAAEKLGNTDALIVDLRGNGGGIMEQAVKMAEYFLPEGALIVSTEGANVKSQHFEARRNGAFTKGRAVILLDSSSASASEIVAGALQDWDRAAIIGVPSFGKGLVQRQVALPDSSAVRITVSRYHTPTGRVIQRPYENGKRNEYYLAHRQRMLSSQADSLADDGRPEYKTLRTGRTVYGGGGITPDIIVEADTTLVTDCILKLTAKGVVVDFLYNYLDRSRDSLAMLYDDFGKFDREFAVTGPTLDEFFAAAAEKGIECSEEERPRTERFVKRFIKAYAARTLFSNSEYVRVLNENDDPVYRTAVETILDPEKMKSLLTAADNKNTRQE